jgi:hypothetical protein
MCVRVTPPGTLQRKIVMKINGLETIHRCDDCNKDMFRTWEQTAPGHQIPGQYDIKKWYSRTIYNHDKRCSFCHNTYVKDLEQKIEQLSDSV